MAKSVKDTVTMRVRLGDSEIEVTGPSDFVETKIQEFINNTKSTVTTDRARTSQPARAPTESPAKKTSPGQFFKACNPRSDVNAVLVAAYYLEKIEGKSDFLAQELRDVITRAKRQPPRNPNDAVNQNIRKGLIMSAGDRDNKMAFVLTSDGEESVESMVGAGS